MSEENIVKQLEVIKSEGNKKALDDFMKYPASMRQSLGTANLHKGFIAAP